MFAGNEKCKIKTLLKPVCNKHLLQKPLSKKRLNERYVSKLTLVFLNSKYLERGHIELPP